MSDRRWLREIEKLVEDNDCEIVSEIVSGKNHLKYRLRKNGVEFTIVASGSPSDKCRSLKNLESDLRKTYSKMAQRQSCNQLQNS